MTAEPAAQASPPGPKRRRFARWLWRLGVALLVLLIAAELFARFYLGLGDPPLWMDDPVLEYRFQPSREYNRFGNRVAFNAYSMRSDDFPQRKSRPNELRILFLGDSVINGGAPTDQADLATEILKNQLTAELARPVVVGNASAGSWGPPNLLAYVRKFGWFDADLIVIVLSSHDAGDAPTFSPMAGVQPYAPDRRPLLALIEGAERYLPRYLERFKGGSTNEGPPPPPRVPSDEEVKTCVTALETLIAEAKATGAPVVVVMHAERSELQTVFRPGHAQLAEAAERAGVPVVDLAPRFRKALNDGASLYRDNIHPNSAGQRVIANGIKDAIKEALASPIGPASGPRPESAPAGAGR